ncbi:type I pantothenate kinase [Ursidibacter maritimus]|uniref:Pantothenate kinase n=1 Tax=Ursidibacter maritimus TaxID=1331689 RepID=A0A949T4J3_9PAST|nr:type I pantothenate kinase [Ursidibacter maritimus]KAE9542249.1 type I pantothenate kinase [Ursidibacter maritimus]MBV6524525.1 type I pantothenate kinase [Ursidibacter maritimus]MBV6526250.1 type I pantothenate kinase [Ursidibacter maritimus]MBV6528329.1 type I pantothenate kinase [Ursidibacter maritimus]MBV6529631.1 type I pantothenate kinase [Ursidibacter maritimus]
MNLQKNKKITPFLTFERNQWAELRKSVPLKLTEQDLKPLLGFNEDLSLDEVSTIYLPLARLINYYIDENLKRQQVLHKFLDVASPKVPYIISIAGSVSVGKSTSARILQALLSNWPEERKVSLITTDGFLYPLATLEEKSLLKRKGFPESYDIQSLIRFVSDIKSGKRQVKAPIYSHLTYDIIPDQFNEVDQPDILILEGLNVLQTGMNYPASPHNVFVSDFVDFSIYVDADEDLLKKWYINRFLKFRRSAFSDPNSYFHHFSQLSEQEAISTASTIWDEINGLNLRQNILPSRERANLILVKGDDHAIQTVKLRK